MTLKNKKILIIIGGGIAAYKSLDLIRLLKKNHIHYWFNIFNPVLERDLINNGFKFIAFNLNQKRRNISEIELMCNYSDVFYGIYADKWNFDKKTYCNE